LLLFAFVGAFLELVVVAFYHGYHGCGQPDFAFVLANSKSGSEIQAYIIAHTGFLVLVIYKQKTDGLMGIWIPYIDYVCNNMT
jgi:hypothetical protein